MDHDSPVNAHYFEKTETMTMTTVHIADARSKLHEASKEV